MLQRYVALGDSSTEGLIDPDGRGGFIGWSRRLASRIAAHQGELAYANLGVRGLTTRQIRDTQLAPALALKPDLATLFSGTNDVIARDFDATAFARDSEAMHRALIGGGATLLTFTLPDLAPLMPLARRFTPRIEAMNARLREVSGRTGARLIDFAAHPVATDRRFWHADRIHANAAGHARIADALAHALGLPGADEAWRAPLAPPLRDAPLARGLREAWWHVRYLAPWMIAGLWAGVQVSAAPATADARLVRLTSATGVRRAPPLRSAAAPQPPGR